MFETTTPRGTEGHNISYSDEYQSAKELLDVLPKDWSVHFDWCQILFSDVEYRIDEEKKRVDVQYNKNLRHWWKEVLKEIGLKVKAPSPENA